MTTNSTPRPDDIKEWKPFHHIERACELAAAMDVRWGPDGKFLGSAGFISTPPALTLAQVHIEIARAKMIGGARA